MAHLVKLTQTDTNEELLFNLDTVVSIEPNQSVFHGKKGTVITTRWGRTSVSETLEQIMKLANINGDNDGVLLNEQNK